MFVVAAQSVQPVPIAYKYHPLSLPLLLFLCQRIIILTMPPLLHLPSLPFPPFLSRSFPYPILSLPLSLPLPSRDPTPKSSCEAWGTLWTTSQGPTKPCLQMASGRSWAEYRTSRDRFVEDFFCNYAGSVEANKSRAVQIIDFKPLSHYWFVVIVKFCYLSKTRLLVK